MVIIVDNFIDRIHATLAKGSSYDEIANNLAHTCAKVMTSEMCTLWRVYNEPDGKQRLKLAGTFGVDSPGTLAQEVSYEITPNSPKCDGVTGYVASTLKVVRVVSWGEMKEQLGDHHEGKMDKIQWQEHPAERMRNLLAIPLALGEQIVGVLKVENRVAGSFTLEDEQAFLRLAEPVAVFCKGLLLIDNRDSLLVNVSRKFTDILLRPNELEQITQKAVTTVAKTMNADICGLWLVDSSGMKLVPRASCSQSQRGSAEPEFTLPSYSLTAPGVIPPDDKIDGITAWVAIHRKTFWANLHEDLQKHASWRGKWDTDLWGGHEKALKSFRSMCAVPLIWNDDLLGVLKIETPMHQHTFTQGDHQMFRLLADYVTLLLVMDRQLRFYLLPDFAHVLKSPAGQVAMNLAAMKDELNQSEPDKDVLLRHIELAKRATAVIEVMSKNFAADMPHRMDFQDQKKANIFLNEKIEECIKTLKNLVPQGMKLELHKEDTSPIEIYLTQYEQTWVDIIIFNIVHNSIKFSPANGTVLIDVSQENEESKIRISDQGCGIAEEDLPRIYDAGFGHRAKGWPQGMGMGLATVSSLLNRLGWEPEVQSKKEQGTTFVITIPKGWRKS